VYHWSVDGLGELLRSGTSNLNKNKHKQHNHHAHYFKPNKHGYIVTKMVYAHENSIAVIKHLKVFVLYI